MDTKKEPLVSIIVRTKDRPKLLFEALSTIEKQLYRNIEIVVVNDGGEAIERDTIEKTVGDLQFKYIEHPFCLGRSQALNTGIDNCSGDFVAFLDDDDLFYPNAIKSLVKASIENGVVPVYGQVRCSKFEEKDGKQITVSKTILGEPFYYQKLIFENHIPINSMIIPIDVAKKVGRFDENFEIYEDWDWIIRMSEILQPTYILIEVAEYRIFSSSTLTGKGGSNLHRLYREKLLNKHIDKIDAGAFLDYIQVVIDRVVLDKDRVIFEKTQENIQLNNQVNFHKEQSENHLKHIKWQDSNIEKHLKEIVEQKEYIEWQKDNIEAYQKEIAEQKEYIEWQKQNLDRQESLLKEQMEHILWLRDVKESLSKTIEDKDKILEHKEEVIKSLISTVESQKDEISCLTDENLKLVEIDKQKSLIIGDLKKDCEDLRYELTLSKRQIDEILSSRAWRLICKFRKIYCSIFKF
ncbi:MAG: glycosyltransferase [Desulfamplus sp.]|nr:glycosyltransferase [Desulfamplus sp.]